MAPLFSIIIVDYEGTVPRETFRRKMKCLADQTDKDFEVLVYHDGPKTIPYEVELADAPFHPATRFFTSDERENCWGHTNRDRGIRAADGEWIIHSNADNIFYPDLIEVVGRYARDPSERLDVTAMIHGGVDFFGTELEALKHVTLLPYVHSRPQAFVFAIKLCGHGIGHAHVVKLNMPIDRSEVLLSGYPISPGRIDAMQYVMRRDLWLAEGGWHDTTKDSDGLLYMKFARKYHVHPIPYVLGEHW